LTAGCHSVDPQPVGDIVENRLGKRIGTLEDHAYAMPQIGHVERAKIFVVEQDLALEAGILDRVVDPVQVPQERRLAAATVSLW
jgi:hypothetical protein